MPRPHKSGFCFFTSSRFDWEYITKVFAGLLGALGSFLVATFFLVAVAFFFAVAFFLLESFFFEAIFCVGGYK
jgi:hypothetical protein